VGEKECVSLGIVAIPSKKGRPPKDPLVLVNNIPTGNIYL